MARRNRRTNRQRGRSPGSERTRRGALWVGTAAGTALVGVVVTDVYGRITDGEPAEPLSVVASAVADCPGGRYLLPNGVHEQLPTWQQLDSAWVREHGGFDDDPTYLLTIQGTSDRVVVLQALRVVDLERVDPSAQLVGVSKCFGGGDLVPRRFHVDLDASPVSVTGLEGDVDIPGEGGDPAPEFPFTVSVADPEVFEVTIENSHCFCTFELELAWTSGGVNGSTRVLLDGGPFAVAPFLGGADVIARYGYTQAGELVPRS